MAAIYTVPENHYPHIGWAMRRAPSKQFSKDGSTFRSVASVDINLTAAEHRTLREDCGLSLRECASWHRVTERTLNHWESPDKGGPPEKAAAHLAALRGRIGSMSQDHASKLFASLEKKKLENRTEMFELVRYTARDYPSTHFALTGFPYGAHNRFISLCAEIIVAAGHFPLIEYHGINGETAKPEQDFSVQFVESG